VDAIRKQQHQFGAWQERAMSGNHDFNEHEVDAALAIRKRQISEEQMRKFEG
jgi:hypothetical protein